MLRKYSSARTKGIKSSNTSKIAKAMRIHQEVRAALRSDNAKTEEIGPCFDAANYRIAAQSSTKPIHGYL
jgi:hypothetical protein